MSIEQSEHAKWVGIKQLVMAEHNAKIDGVLSDSAARGFYRPPGKVLENIIDIGQVTKVDLTNKNGKLYEEQRNIIFQVDEFALKLTLEYAKLELAIYQHEILNAVSIELTQMKNDFKENQADITRKKAEINERNVFLIKAKADQEAEVTAYRIRQEEAKRLGLDKLTELLEAQKETAAERLKVIDALKIVIEAEELIVEAENRKADAMELVVKAETILADIKKGLIPLYEELAVHKKAQAGAIKDEAGWKAKIINLGYDRIDLKQAEAASFISREEANKSLEVARTGYVVASIAVDEARIGASKLLAEKKNVVTDTIIPLKEQLDTDKIDLGLNTSLERFVRDIQNSIAIQQERNIAIGEKLTAELQKITDIANSQQKQIRHCATTETITHACRDIDQYIPPQS